MRKVTAWSIGAAHLAGLVLGADHPGGVEQRHVGSARMVAEEVETMQAPVQGVRHRHRSHAHVPVDLHIRDAACRETPPPGALCM